MEASKDNTDALNGIELMEIEEDDSPLSKKERLKLFLSASWQGILILIIPIIFIFVLVPFPPQKYQWCAYTLLLMASYWVTECIPLPITSFLPVLIFPLSGVMTTSLTCRCYMNDTIVMFFGSMALAYAVEQSGLHRRLALGAIRTIGYSHYRLLFTMCFTTMFVSMWIANTAATTMMVPINFALLKVFEDQNLLTVYERTSHGNLVASDITTCYFCACTFSATIGGIGTLVGTATNLVFKGLFERTFPAAGEIITFPSFSAFAVPFMLMLEISLYIYFLFFYFGFLRPNSKAAKRSKISEEGVMAAKNKVDEDWKKLGAITFWEIMVIILFVGAMIMFFCRSPHIFYGWGDMISDYFNLNSNNFARDSAVCSFVIFLMLLLPSTLDFFKKIKADDNELTNKRIPSVLNWFVMNDAMPFGFMFLLGGGFALSEAAKKEYSDLNGRIGDILSSLHYLPNPFIILLIIIFTVIVTNFAANVAVANVFVPIVMQLAKEVDIHPLWYNITAGFTASFCFCLPVGTPGNLIVQGAAKIPTIKMVKIGIIPTLMSILISWISFYIWAPVVWSDLHNSIKNQTWLE